MQKIHNGFKIDLRSHFSILCLGVKGSKTNQKGKAGHNLSLLVVGQVSLRDKECSILEGFQ